MAKRHQHVVRSVTPVGGPREVKIEDAATRYGLIALSKNVTKLQTRLQAEVEVAQKAFQVTQAQFRQDCQEAATKLGIDVTDQSVSIRFDDEKGAFTITSSQQDESAPAEAPVEESVELDAPAEAES